MKNKNRKCPVCDWELKDSFETVQVGGRSVAVCCEDCANKVKTNPGKYLPHEV